MTLTLLQAVLDPLQKHHATGLVLDVFLQGNRTFVTPPRDGNPSIWVVVGKILFTQRDGGGIKRLKSYEIGVVFFWPDGRDEFAIFDARQLWDRYIDPKEIQLELWPGL